MTAILVAFAIDCSHATVCPECSTPKPTDAPALTLNINGPTWVFTPEGVEKIRYRGDIAYHAFGKVERKSKGTIVALEPFTDIAESSLGGADWILFGSRSLRSSQIVVFSGQGSTVKLYGQDITICNEKVLTPIDPDRRLENEDSNDEQDQQHQRMPTSPSEEGSVQYGRGTGLYRRKSPSPPAY